MSSSSDTPDEAMTFIERFNKDENDELFEAMLSMPTDINESMVESRREELFDMFWNELSLSRHEVLSKVKAREEDFINEYEDVAENLPEWMLRLEAQDVMLQYLHDRMTGNL